MVNFFFNIRGNYTNEFIPSGKLLTFTLKKKVLMC